MRTPIHDPFFDGDGPLLDPDALEASQPPRRLSRDEGWAAVGPDWIRTHHHPDEDIDHG